MEKIDEQFAAMREASVVVDAVAHSLTPGRSFELCAERLLPDLVLLDAATSPA